MASPAVIRSLYRGLYREARYLDQHPLVKTFFPYSKELKDSIGSRSFTYVPNGREYVEVLRDVFSQKGKAINLKLAFDTLTRLRAHRERVNTQLPVISRDHDEIVRVLKGDSSKGKALYRAAPVSLQVCDGPRYVPISPYVPSPVALRTSTSLEIAEGTVLIAHPLSSTHVDRRVVLITERMPLTTTALVLDLKYTFPISRGNPMFPEVFWGHDLYEGGASQFDYTMPPVPHIQILHTLDPLPVEEPTHATATTTTTPLLHHTSRSWLPWKMDTTMVQQPSSIKSSEDAIAAARARHRLSCRTLIEGGTLDDGTREPTLYVSGVEALPYLSKLAVGQPRASLRLYWGCMRWSTAQLDAEVGDGHFAPVKISPSFFRPHHLARRRDETFPTANQLRDAKTLRERRYMGADVAPPQNFPLGQVLSVRECLWDEIMYALGGEYAELVGSTNPFSAGTTSSGRWPTTQILSSLPIALEEGKEIDDGKETIQSDAAGVNDQELKRSDDDATGSHGKDDGAGEKLQPSSSSKPEDKTGGN